jgi:shikimate kinase
MGACFSRLVLTGFMGAGKSTVGQLLSRKMEWAFLDIDQYIESSAGVTAKDIFASRGESAFRRLESDALAFALKESETIIALGGAAIDSTENQLLLLNANRTLVVFLDAPFVTLVERCLVQERSGRAPYRPLLHQTEVAQARFFIRRSLYQGHASFAVDVADRSAEEVAFLIWNIACRQWS